MFAKMRAPRGVRERGECRVVVWGFTLQTGPRQPTGWPSCAPVSTFDAMDAGDDEAEGEEVGLLEHAFGCPYCGESITMLLDLSEPDQEYVEDCEVCCNPIGLHVRARRGALVDFDATALG